MLCSRFFGLFPWHPSCGNTPTPGGHSSRSLEAMDQAKPRVLVVDDDPLTRSLLSIALQSQAFEVIPAGDAGAALEQVRSEAPEIVILDLRLPGLDGMEALRKFKEIAPELPVVILTGFGDVPSAVEAMRLGAYDFLPNPLSLQRFSSWSGAPSSIRRWARSSKSSGGSGNVTRSAGSWAGARRSSR